ncbi:MAG: DUF6074 family protein [Shinella sp.]|nr:DUF6074 family protein [Shinella sp.]
MAVEHAYENISPSQGRTIPFPLAWRKDLVRECAEGLENLHGEEALLFWRARCRELADELISQRCGEEDARREILAFQEAVQRELVCRHARYAEASGR